jgi:LmbE family N-acetylglucosaminyl deacetylase
VIDEGGYDLVIGHWWGDHHQDHVAASRITHASCRAGVGGFWVMEVPQYTVRSHSAFEADVFVDISSSIDRKLAALRCYESWAREEDVQQVEALARYRAGIMRGSTHVEAFKSVFTHVAPGPDCIRLAGIPRQAAS